MREHAACVQKADSATSMVQWVSAKFVTPKEWELQRSWRRTIRSHEVAPAGEVVAMARAHPMPACPARADGVLEQQGSRSSRLVYKCKLSPFRG